MNSKEILELFKKNKLYGIFIDSTTKTIYKITNTILGRRKITALKYPLFDIIKLNNQCNYFTFREHIHDIKSHINASYGLLSILEYDFSQTTDEVTGYDINMGKELLKEVNESMEKMTHFTNESIQKYEAVFNGPNNLSDLLLFYLPSVIDRFIIDSHLNNEFNDCYRIVKTIMDRIKEKNLRDIIIKLSNDNIIICDLMGNEI